MKETTVTVQIDVCMHERISFKICEQETEGLLSANLQAAARLCKFSLNSHKRDCSQTNCSWKNLWFLVYNVSFKPAHVSTWDIPAHYTNCKI